MLFDTITLAINDGLIRQAWNKLIRTIQTEVEHKRVWNYDAAPAIKATVMYPHTSNRSMSPATAAVAGVEACEAVGVMEETMPATGESVGHGIMRTQGLAYVKFNNGLNPNEGDAVYVSATAAGFATTVNTTYKIGVIADATPYTGSQCCWVWLGHCCTPYHTPN